MKPLEGITVLDFGQFLAAPSGAMRLADLGAHVIKVEKEPDGDVCRRMYTSNLIIEGESSLFQSINRNKDGISLNLKSEEGRRRLEPLIRRADVVIVNFRPGVAARLGLSYQQVSAINPRVIYGEITGYGPMTDWAARPGQDLLVQSLSGLCWLNGNGDQPPVPMGLSVVDMFAGQQMVQGILAALVGRETSGEGACIQASLMEAALDMQFEVLTTYLNDGKRLPERSSVNNANVYTNAPYGIYATEEGYLALAMVNIPYLGELIGCEALLAYQDEADWSEKRDEIKAIIRDHLMTRKASQWLEILEPKDIWCARVLNWEELMESDGFRALEFLQEVEFESGRRMTTTRCPITIDGERYRSAKPAPSLGQDNGQYLYSD